MIDFDQFEDEGVVWRRFSGWLAETVAQSGEGESIVIDMVAPDDSMPGAPSVQIEALPQAGLRAIALANADLGVEWQLDDEAHAAILELRWAELPSATGACMAYYIQAPAAMTTALADAVTAAFRDVYDVGHPSFLAADETRCSSAARTMGAH